MTVFSTEDRVGFTFPQYELLEILMDKKVIPELIEILKEMENEI